MNGALASTASVLETAGFQLPAAQRRPIRWALYIGYAALTAGVFHGLAQALSYAGIDVLPMPASTSCATSPPCAATTRG